MFEQLFRRLEDESAQRALEEEERERIEAQASDSTPSPQPAAEALPVIASPVQTIKERRRGSISVSRFGGITVDTNDSRTQSTRPSRSSSIVHTKPTFYQLDTRYQAHAGSADSFASNSGADPAADVEDEPEITQTTFAPRQSISKAIARRLSRARDVVPLPSPTATSTVVIGVAVEEATTEHYHSSDDDCHSAHGVSSAQVYSGTILSQRSSPGLNEKSSSSGWVSKARDITAKIRRRSLAAIHPGSISPPR
ncbi:hypothetical protein EW026_g3745 [Hermanssonia centrifuga]|uniref:Uncharacterized protein n=1 Tax=Hermanssonia centrifuga TaxID=98765 RepID=A0A4S4KKF2_9APHY|nr:hypothetical protein EW026_g3745 [Hermanssonia centrifuga]